MSRPRAQRIALPLLAVALALGLAACGEDREGGSVSVKTTETGTGTTETGEAKVTGPAVATVKVSETEYKLDPANPKVSKAGVVEFVATNDGKIAHALEVEGPKGEAETEHIAPGKSASLKVDMDKPGTYTWYCPIDDHKKLGMRGEVTVAGGGSGGGSTTQEQKDTGGAQSPGY